MKTAFIVSIWYPNIFSNSKQIASQYSLVQIKHSVLNDEWVR